MGLCCAKASPGSHAHWEVDLGAEYSLQKIKVAVVLYVAKISAADFFSDNVKAIKFLHSITTHVSLQQM